VKKAAALTERITFERVTLTSDGGGGSTEAWTTQYSCAARVMPMTGSKAGNEQATADKLQAVVNYMVTVRRSTETAAITAKDRIDWRGKKMQIRAIADSGPSPLYMEIICEAGVNT